MDPKERARKRDAAAIAARAARDPERERIRQLERSLGDLSNEDRASAQAEIGAWRERQRAAKAPRDAAHVELAARVREQADADEQRWAEQRASRAKGTP